MDINVLFAAMPVTDFETAQAWYERFFARPADVVAHKTEVMWQITEGAWLYVVGDPDRAGRSTVAIAVSDIEQTTSALATRGLQAGPIEPEGDAGRKAMICDPDGNSIAIIEVRSGG
jgi:predicted enzyme related to lactoylglutathione lyase